MSNRKIDLEYISVCRLGAFALLTGLLLGCASGPPVTSNYDASQGVTTYKTRPVSLSGLRMGSGYGSNARVQLRALASCSGEDCTPNEVLLVFQLSGSSDLRLENRNVKLTADGQTFRSEKQSPEINQTITDIDVASGNVASIRLPFSKFRRIAEAEKLSGSLGTSSFSLSYDRRRFLRALIEKTQGG